MPAQRVAGYGIGVSIYVNGHCGDRPIAPANGQVMPSMKRSGLLM
jgi:hypothetical protein